MGYALETTVDDHRHLVSLLASFLTAEGGWTFDSDVDAAERELHVHKTHGGEVFHFSIKTTATDNVEIQGHTGYPAAGSSDTVFLELSTSSMVRAWFFGGDLYCYIIVEVASGYFQMGGFGRLTPYDAFSNDSLEGAFVFGNDGTSSLVATTSWYNDEFYLNNNSAARNIYRHKPVAGAEWGSGLAIGNDFFSETGMLVVSNTNGAKPMLPLRVRALNNPTITGYQNRYSLGFFPAMRQINLYLVPIASEETIGADVWKRFRLPHFRPASGSLIGQLYEMGLAFLKS